MLYNYRTVMPTSRLLHRLFIDDWSITIGSALIGIVAICSDFSRSMLTKKPFQELAKISYSLYLLHMPIIIFSVYLFGKEVSLNYIWPPLLLSIICFSKLFWKFIENPSMKIGQFYSNQNDKKSKFT